MAVSVGLFEAIFTALLLLLIRFVFQAIYRVTYHPLAGFPGPKLAGITYLYEYYYNHIHGKGAGGQYYAKIDLLHKQYGPIVRVNPDEVHIKDSSYYSNVYASAPARRDKHPSLALIGGDLQSVFSTQEHELHRARRAAVAPLFSKRAVNEHERVIWNLLEPLHVKLDKMPGPFELQELFIPLSTDIVANFALGKPLGFQKDGQSAKAWKTTLHSLAELTPIVRMIPSSVALMLSLPQWITRALAPKTASITALYSRIRGEAQMYLDQKTFDTNVRNVHEQLRTSSLPDFDKSPRRCADEVLTLVLAGSESSSSTMALAIYHILKDTGILTKLRDEIAEAYPSPTAQPSLAELQNLPYLNAVIRECMRLTGFFLARFTVLAHEQLDYHGWKIPPMTPVSMNLRDVLRDAQLWPEPDKFVPERWIAEGKRNTDMDKYWVAFGRGHRMCLGKELALAELFIVISSVLRRHDLELYKTEWARDIELTRDCFIGLPRPGSRGVRVVNRGPLA